MVERAAGGGDSGEWRAGGNWERRWRLWIGGSRGGDEREESVVGWGGERRRDNFRAPSNKPQFWDFIPIYSKNVRALLRSNYGQTNLEVDMRILNLSIKVAQRKFK